MKRIIFASQETEFRAGESSNKLVKVYSFFPVDRADCPCQKVIYDWKKRLGSANQAERLQLLEQTEFIECPRDKTLMTRYEVKCKSCKQVQGYCWATNETLNDWCDFHYVQWSNGVTWKGCLTPHISPVSEQLCLECCCGQDTRDFRANMTLSEKIAVRMEKENSKGREFAKSDSKFLVNEVK